MASVASIDDLKSGFKGDVTQPGQDTYSVSRWSSLAEKQAQFVIYPKDANDVSIAIKFAVRHKLDLSIRGGGHSTGGQSSSEGLVIDFSKHLNGARVDAEKKIAYVEGGCKTVTLEKLTIEHGLGATLGMASQVGVIGQLIGGGIGLSVGQHGLALDNIISATVVLSNGDIVTASESEHSDLFWAIRGGGSNFGAIVEVAIKLHTQRPDIHIRTFVYSPEKLPEVVKELAEYRLTQATDEFVFLVLTLCPMGTPVIALNARKNCDEASGEAAFQRFGKIGPMANMPRQIPYEELCTQSDPYVADGLSRIAHSSYTKDLTVDLAQEIWDTLMDVINKTPATGSYVIFECFHPAKLVSVPADATAYAQRTEDMVTLIQVEYPKGEAGSITQADELVNRIKRSVDSKAHDGDTSTCGYPPYSDVTSKVTGTDERSKTMFGGNYRRLQQIKMKYDPEMVFNKWFPIHPAA